MNSFQSAIIPPHIQEYDRLMVRLVCGHKRYVLPLINMKYDGIFFEIFSEHLSTIAKLPVLIHSAAQRWLRMYISEKNISTSVEAIQDNIGAFVYAAIEKDFKIYEKTVQTNGLAFVAKKIDQIQIRRIKMLQRLQAAEVVPLDADRFCAGDKLLDYEIKGVFFPWLFMESYNITEDVRLSTRLTKQALRLLFANRDKYRSWGLMANFLRHDVKMQSVAFRDDSKNSQLLDKISG